MPDISIVIPAFNEQLRLPATLESVYNYLQQAQFDFEIVVVNDGSKDATVEVVQEFAKHHNGTRLISYSSNKGKGYAVRAGMLAATGKFILMNDADGSSPIEEINRLIDAIAGGADIAIGSRAKPDISRSIKALPYRTYIGNIFSSIVRSLAVSGIYDTQCGFKLFKEAIAKELFSLAQIDGYAFDVEILYLARQKNYVIEEVAINWHNVDGSKINLLFDPLKMLGEIIKIKINNQMGLYGKKLEVKTHD